MRFVHMADIHFDTPFTFLNSQNNLGNIRRLDQRDVFKKTINYIKDNNVPYLFITGDLYDHHDAEGFITLFGLPLKVRAMKMQEAEKNK